MSAAETPDEAADSAHGAKVGGSPPTMCTRLLEVQGEDEEIRLGALDFLSGAIGSRCISSSAGRGGPEEEANDLIQAFFTVDLIRNLFARANPEFGRFRNFLLQVAETLPDQRQA
jgi:hypothetical protein